MATRKIENAHTACIIFPFFFILLLLDIYFQVLAITSYTVNILTCLFVDISQSLLLGVYSTVKLLDHKYTNLALVNPAH